MGGCFMTDVIERGHEWLDTFADYASMALSALMLLLVIISQF